MLIALRLIWFLPPAPSNDRRARGPVHADAAPSPDDTGAPSEDAEVIARIRASDRSVFTQMVATHATRLLTLAFSVLGTRDDAEDVVQDVMLRVWAARTSWAPQSSVHAYLAAAVRRRAVDIVRHRRVIARNAPMLADAQRPDLNGTPYDDPQNDASLWAAVATLEPRWREAITLRYVNRLGYADVGRALGVSTDAARMTVNRAVQALREALARVDRSLIPEDDDRIV
jgi:RNA polymerase sigma-70 factor (ECF subfamily)